MFEAISKTLLYVDYKHFNHNKVTNQTNEDLPIVQDSERTVG